MTQTTNDEGHIIHEVYAHSGDAMVPSELIETFQSFEDAQSALDLLNRKKTGNDTTMYFIEPVTPVSFDVWRAATFPEDTR